jgi:hypothetical protein
MGKTRENGVSKLCWWRVARCSCVSIRHRHLFERVERNDKGLYRAGKWGKHRGSECQGKNNRENGWRWCGCVRSIASLAFVLSLIICCKVFLCV